MLQPNVGNTWIKKGRRKEGERRRGDGENGKGKILVKQPSQRL